MYPCHEQIVQSKGHYKIERNMTRICVYDNAWFCKPLINSSSKENKRNGRIVYMLKAMHEFCTHPESSLVMWIMWIGQWWGPGTVV
jgi:hypothetical protein